MDIKTNEQSELNADFQLRDKLGDKLSDLENSRIISESSDKLVSESNINDSDTVPKTRESEPQNTDRPKTEEEESSKVILESREHDRTDEHANAILDKDGGKITTQDSSTAVTNSSEMRKDENETPYQISTPQESPSLRPSEEKHSKTISSKSPKAQFSEIEDEQTIRIENQPNKRESPLNDSHQVEEKFDVKDLSFFDTPANTPTDLHIPHGEQKMNSPKETEILEKPVHTLQSPVSNIIENESHEYPTKGIAAQQGKPIDRSPKDMIDQKEEYVDTKTTDENESNGKESIKNKMTDHVSEINNEMSEIQEPSVHTLQGQVSNTGENESHEYPTQRKDAKQVEPIYTSSKDTVDQIKATVDTKTTDVNDDSNGKDSGKNNITESVSEIKHNGVNETDTPHTTGSPFKDHTLLKEDHNEFEVKGIDKLPLNTQYKSFSDQAKTKQTVQMKSSSTYKSYEADFEDDDITTDRENSQAYFSDSQDTKCAYGAKETSPKLTEQKNNDLLIEEITNTDMFGRSLTKSSIKRNTTTAETRQMETPEESAIHKEDIAEVEKDIPTKNNYLDKLNNVNQENTVKHIKNGEGVLTIDKVQTFRNEESDREQSPKQVHAIKEFNQTKDNDKRNEQEADVNAFFTGRLPTLIGPEDEDYNHSKKAEQNDDIHIKENDEPDKVENRSNYKGTEDDLKRIKREHDSYTDKGDSIGGLQGKGTNKDAEIDAASENRSTSRIIELIQEINAPAQKFHMSKERSLTPRTPTNKPRFDDYNTRETSRTATSESKGYHEQERENTDTLGVGKTDMKVGDINHLTSSVMSKLSNDEAKPTSKFDGFPHIQEISQYNRANKLADVPNEQTAENQTKHENKTTHLPKLHPESAVRHVYSREKSEHSALQTIESTTVIGHHYIESQTPEAGTQDPNKRCSSENDLKAVVASAKRAYRGQEMAPTSLVLPPINREGTSESGMPNIKQDDTQTRSSFRTTKSSDYTSAVLICSKCLNQDSQISSAGFCKECQQYLCGNCIQQHKDSRRTKRHEIMVAYCVKELEVKKYVKATGYCVDCQHFLCMKCVIHHTGYRANRYHRVIQSSFMSKPNKRLDRTPRDEVHVSYPLNTRTASDDEKSERDLKTVRNRKKILKDLSDSNSYRVKSESIPESLYPGPNKKLGISYADNPKWPEASVPKLPYLVKPRSLQERAFQSPYVSYQKSAFFTHPKAAFDPSQVKMRSLQARYTATTGEPRRTQRRREEKLFTARRANISDGSSLPDFHSKTTQGQGQKEERQTSRRSRLRKAKFLKDYCISIPFPSGERQSDILGIACLPNGNILIADKHNNNVKLYTKQFKFKALVQFSNRLTDICSSNLCPVDLFVATQKHVFQITTMRKGLEVQKKIKVDVKRIEGLACWKYGLAVIHKKTNLTWEVMLMDYRGNSKSKLEIMNPLTQEIDSGPVCYVTTIKGGKRIILTDTKNACMICTDVTSRCVLYETSLPDDSPPSYVTSDNQHNVFVSCPDKIQQLSKEGNNVGTVISKSDGVDKFGCILYNRSTELLYVQTAQDIVSVYQMT